MKRALNLITVVDLIFLFLLSISASVEGSLTVILIYIAAFIIPVIAAIFARQHNEKISFESLLPNKATLPYLIPFAAPFLGLVLLIAFLTSLLLGAFGLEDTATDVSGNLMLVILRHAVLPALLEELLFRFIPIELFGNYSKKGAVIYSAIFFAAIHCNLFQIPYAFAAGFVLAVITLISGSVFPAVVLHFLNNLLSIFLMRYTSAVLHNTVYISLAVLSIISLLYLFLKREKYLPKAKELFSDKCKLSFTLASFLFLVMTVTVSIYNIVQVLYDK